MNRLEVNLQQAIQALHARGWSQRRIARELNIDRGTVADHVRPPNPAISTAGSAEVATPNPAISTPGCEGVAEPKPAISTPGPTAGRVSLCREFLPTITTAVTAGLSAKRIHQDLVADHGFTGSYQSVKRCVQGLAVRLALPHRRMECAPGEQMQVDFGQGAPVIDEHGKRRRPGELGALS